jgi:uncharacterized protein YdhG (YjbR/CyaY superfamily)
MDLEEKKTRPASIDEYIAQFPPDVQAAMHTLRRIIMEAAPQAEERISYGMPGFYYHGMLVWFGGHKNHIGFYPTGEGVEAFKQELAGYKMSKGAVQLPLGQAVPEELICKIVQHRVEVNQEKKISKT